MKLKQFALMSKKDLEKLDKLLTKFQQHLDSKYTLHSAYERVAMVRKDVSWEIDDK